MASNTGTYMKQMKRDRAISQNIIILISGLVLLILLGLGVYLVLLEPVPEEIPTAVIDIKVTGEEEENIILTNLQGDDLDIDKTIVRINDQIINPAQLQFISGTGWPWTPGSAIQIYYPHEDKMRTVDVYTVAGKERKELLLNRVQFAPPPKVEKAPLAVVILAVLAPTPVPTGIEVEQFGANPLLPIVTDFSVDVRVGDPPLTVQFWDLSQGSPDQYFWSFGDGTTSNMRNPIHTYFVPGSYDISLRSSNMYHTDYKAAEGFITVGMPPIAEFFAEPVRGQTPLTVVFTDLSIGSPRNWEWSFGDGGTSNEKNPFYIYQKAGAYTVGLTVTNAYGSSKEIKTDYVVVSASTSHDIYLLESSTGYLNDEGSITLRVTKGPSSIKIGGRIIPFEVGDIIQLIINDGTLDGEIYIAGSGLHEFRFSDVTLLKNNEFVARGSINSAKVSEFDSYKSTLAIRIPPGDQYTNLFIDSKPAGYQTNPQMLFRDLGPGSSEKMSYKKSARNLNYQGGVGSYQTT